MRALRIAALGLLPAVGACWMERPNLQSTGGGYKPEAAAATAPQAGVHGAAAGGEEGGAAETSPASLNP